MLGTNFREIWKKIIFLLKIALISVNIICFFQNYFIVSPNFILLAYALRIIFLMNFKNFKL